jgi:uncharacterized protein YqeY
MCHHPRLLHLDCASYAPQNPVLIFHNGPETETWRLISVFRIHSKDMKVAMQNKDTNRLTVLRSLMSQTLNASKTANPISTDLQMLALLRKNVNSARMASAEFREAGREDLAEKEENQVKVMEEYAGTVETMGEEDIRAVVQKIVDSMKEEGLKVHMGDVLKRVFAPEALGQKPVEKGEVARVVKQLLSA